MLGLLGVQAHAVDRVWVVIGCRDNMGVRCEEVIITETNKTEVFASSGQCEQTLSFSTIPGVKAETNPSSLRCRTLAGTRRRRGRTETRFARQDDTCPRREMDA
jgi:hypothetical protein